MHPKKKCWLDDGQHAQTCVLFCIWESRLKTWLHLTHCMGSLLGTQNKTRYELKSQKAIVIICHPKGASYLQQSPIIKDHNSFLGLKRWTSTLWQWCCCLMVSRVHTTSWMTPRVLESNQSTKQATNRHWVMNLFSHQKLNSKCRSTRWHLNVLSITTLYSSRCMVHGLPWLYERRVK